ncbi:MAG: carbohydrate ABC transporter permease [Candidatus Fimadaptatus sp.]|jgi:putative aldouronate transport system permease protein
MTKSAGKTAATHSSMNRMTRGDKVFETVNCIFLGIITVIILYPLIYVLSASISDPMSVTSGKMLLWPVDITMDNYAEVFKNDNIMTGYRNSLAIMFMGTAINIVMTLLAAYPLSRRDLWGRGVIMKLLTVTMFFGGGLIPTYLMVGKTLKLMDSWLALILPGALSVYNMIIMRTYFQTSIPYELQEAAEIDGCSPVVTLIRIMLPMSGPIIAVLCLYYGVGHWNSYFNALLYIRTESIQPLQLYLRKVLTANNMQSLMEMGADEAARQAMRAETIKYSVIVVSSIPMLIIYPFVQRFFVKGVMIGAIKG